MKEHPHDKQCAEESDIAALCLCVLMDLRRGFARIPSMQPEEFIYERACANGRLHAMLRVRLAEASATLHQIGVLRTFVREFADAWGLSGRELDALDRPLVALEQMQLSLLLAQRAQKDGQS